MEQFEQLLTCAICLDRYRNPKLLPCQHSFCMEPCMDGLVDYVRRQVKCPECRAEHRIPYQGVQAFPTNVTLQRFLELHIEITGELPDPTSGQIMERCSVCSEKSYCNTCAHCEKKCCPECKDEHVKILRKNIVSINSQVRRALHRLQETLAQVEKNTVALQTNAASVSEEVDEIYRRLNKALKDRTEVLRCEIDRYLGQELKSLIHLKENLEQEIANIQSNCDLADQHINENVPWDDNELLDTKELFLRTLEFIRNFEYEAGDYTRRMRFVMTHEPNQLVLHVAGYGELNIKPEGNASTLLGGVGCGGSGVGGSSSLTVPGSGGSPGLMRSKSDHRLASQYRSQQDDDRSHGRNRYVPDYEYDTPEYEAPRSRSRYRSRFMRNREGDDSDGGDGGGVSGQNTSTTSGRSGTSVRFNAPNSGGGDHHHHHSAREHRERVLDTEDASRGPLSGIFRLTDSPRVIKKLNECERAGKRKKSEQTTQQAAAAAAANQPKQQIQPGQGRNKSSTPFVGRQVSEDDEISRIKKLNKNAPGEPRQATPAATAAAVQESLAEQERRAATPTSTTTSPAARRTTSRERDTELAEETSSNSRKTPSSRKTSSELHGSGTGGVAGGRSNSSESTGSTESAGGGGGGSSIRSTGAPFTTEEMKQKFLARSPQNTSSSSATAGSLGSNRSSPVTSTATTATTPRPFQSRFLGNRTTTPAPSTTTTPESKTSSNSNGSSSLTSTPSAVSKSRSEEEEDDDDEETSSSSEETESESEEDSEPEATPATPTRSSVPSSPLSTTGTGGGYKRNESAMSRTDIGPLLARSAEARRGSKEDSPSTRQASSAAAVATAAQNDSNELLLSSSSSPAALDDAQAARENETNRKLESKRIFQARKKAFKKTAGRVAIGVCETLFG